MRIRYVDEELVRLRSHISAVRRTLETGDDQNGIGRKLNFWHEGNEPGEITTGDRRALISRFQIVQLI